MAERTFHSHGQTFTVESNVIENSKFAYLKGTTPYAQDALEKPTLTLHQQLQETYKPPKNDYTQREDTSQTELRKLIEMRRR